MVELNRNSLPPDRRDDLTRQALEVIALTALKRARRLLGAGDRDAARAQAREALRTSRSPAVLERRAELAAIGARRSILRALRLR